MRLTFLVALLGLSVIGACGRETDSPKARIVPGEVFYFPDAPISAEGFETLYETQQRFRFTIPKQWKLMQSTQLWMIEEDGSRVELESSLDGGLSNTSDDRENLIVARQFNIADPAILISLTLLNFSGESDNTQSGLHAFTFAPEFEQSTQEFQRSVENQFGSDPSVIEYLWSDGGVQKHGDWMCTFYVMDTVMVSGVENTHTSMYCPAGAKTINVIGIIARENKDVVLRDISSFVASMDVTEADWIGVE